MFWTELLEPEYESTMLFVEIGNRLVNKITLKHSHISTSKFSWILTMCLGVYNDNVTFTLPFVGRGVSIVIDTVYCFSYILSRLISIISV